MPPRIVLTDTPVAAARDAIAQGLGRYNEAACGPGHHRPLGVLLRDDAGDYVGGLWGRTAWRWLFVELLFVPEPLRRSGLGRDLMRRAEAEAAKRGCHSVWLDTFSFQARGFYEKLGYSVFGRLADFPPGHTRFFLRKTLSARRKRKPGARQRAARTRPRWFPRARS
jgi:GNAT superfamily N-acetyltransferase